MDGRGCAENKSAGMAAWQAHPTRACAWDASQHSKDKFARGTSSVKREQIIFIKAVEEFEEQDAFLLHAPHAGAWGGISELKKACPPRTARDTTAGRAGRWPWPC